MSRRSLSTSNASFRTTDPSGYQWGHADEEEPAELDPTGANAGLIAPIVQPFPPTDMENDSLLRYPTWHDPRRPGLTYAVEGIQVTVEYFFQQLETSTHGSFIGSSLRGEMANSRREWVQAAISKTGDMGPGAEFGFCEETNYGCPR